MYSDKAQSMEAMNAALMVLFNEVLHWEEAWLMRRGMEQLTLAEMHMLVAISNRENGAMSEVAKQASLSNGTVTTTVKRLEKKGFVVRARDENDTRKLRVRLSESGRAAVALHDQFHEALSEQIYDHLGEAKTDIFVEGVECILDFLKIQEEAPDA